MLQKLVRDTLYSAACVLGLLLYADGADARRKEHHYHPIIMYIANFTLDGLRSQRGYARLAHMCVLDIKDYPCFAKKPQESVPVPDPYFSPCTALYTAMS